VSVTVSVSDWVRERVSVTPADPLEGDVGVLGGPWLPGAGFSRGSISCSAAAWKRGIFSFVYVPVNQKQPPEGWCRARCPSARWGLSRTTPVRSG